MDPTDTEQLWMRGIQALRTQLGPEDADRWVETFHASLPSLVAEMPDSLVSASNHGNLTHGLVEDTESLRVRRPDESVGQTPPSPSERQLLLFRDDEQPWAAPATRVLQDSDQDKVKRIMANLADSRLGSIEMNVAYILQNFPETRDSDTALALRYWRKFQAESLEQIEVDALDVLYELHRIESISRSRRTLQHHLHLFVGKPRTKEWRDVLQKEMHEYLVQKRSEDPEIRFYLDETGNDPKEKFNGVAGICVLDWRHYERFHAALRRWREERCSLASIHFADLDEATRPDAYRLLKQLQKRRSGLLFVGHAIPTRGASRQDLVGLVVHLVVDSLTLAAKQGCISVPKAVRIVKEADPGFDKLYGPGLQRELSDALARELPDQVHLSGIEAVPKGREVLLECADLIAAAMQRRHLYGGHKPKDVLAEAVMNLTGFEDPNDGSVVYRLW